MPNGNSVIVSRHAMARYVQRFLKKHEDDDHAAEQHAMKNTKELSSKIIALIEGGKEDRSYLNDTEFMGYLWKKYKGTKFVFVVNGRAMFVMAETQTNSKTMYVLKTIVDAKNPPRNYFRQCNSNLINNGIPPSDRIC